jgi:hypothetical protein
MHFPSVPPRGGMPVSASSLIAMLQVGEESMLKGKLAVRTVKASVTVARASVGLTSPSSCSRFEVRSHELKTGLCATWYCAISQFFWAGEQIFGVGSVLTW